MDKNKSNKPTQKYKFPLKTWVTSGWYLSIKYITMSSSAELATSIAMVNSVVDDACGCVSATDWRGRHTR